jgi:hypothetical protein
MPRALIAVLLAVLMATSCSGDTALVSRFGVESSRFVEDLTNDRAVFAGCEVNRSGDLEYSYVVDGDPEELVSTLSARVPDAWRDTGVPLDPFHWDNASWLEFGPVSLRFDEAPPEDAAPGLIVVMYAYLRDLSGLSVDSKLAEDDRCTDGGLDDAF